MANADGGLITSTPPTPAEPEPSDDGDKLVTRYAAVCAGLLAVLVLAVIYGVFINDSDTISVEAPDADTSTSATLQKQTTAAGGWADPTDSPAEVGDATDVGMAFTVDGFEVGPAVESAATAHGEYVVVHLTVANVGDSPTTFLGTFQRLLAAGSVYSIDDEATFHLGGGVVELAPGAQADVSLAFDVPPGTVPEAVELHADPVSPGVELPLSS